MLKYLKRLKLYIDESDPEKVSEIILDQTYIGPLNNNFKLCLQQFSNLIHLSLNQTRVSTAKILPRLLSLRILELKQNYLKDKEIELIGKNYPQLYLLDLSYNQIERLKVFKVLIKVPLKILKIKGNPCSNKEDSYYKRLENMISTLQIVDEYKLVDEQNELSDEQSNGEINRKKNYDNYIILEENKGEECTIIPQSDDISSMKINDGH